MPVASWKKFRKQVAQMEQANAAVMRTVKGLFHSVPAIGGLRSHAPLCLRGVCVGIESVR
jgi:hypothetical protein